MVTQAKMAKAKEVMLNKPCLFQGSETKTGYKLCTER